MKYPLHTLTQMWRQIFIVMFCVAFSAVLSGCDNFESSPYAATIKGKCNINATSVEEIQKASLSLPIRFAFLTDTHDSASDIEDAIDIILEDRDVDFIVHGGDLTDFGLPKEFMWCRDLLERARMPYVTVIGNHDCLGNGADNYEWIFGAKNYSFTVAGVHFLCLNTVALEYDYSEPVPDLNFLIEEADKVAKINEEHPDSITHTVVVMHSRPFDEQFNNNVSKPFLYFLQAFPGMEIDEGDTKYSRAFCVCGHNHQFGVMDLYDVGLMFYQGDNIAKRSFMIFTITADGYEMERIEY